jgi:S1-C subfamily serine protease
MTIVSSGLFAQMNVSSDKISSYRWDDLQEDWVLVVNEKEYFTSFEFDEDFTYFLHITSDQTSRYDILSSEYDEERELFNYDIISDVGNEYFMIIDAEGTEIYFVSTDDEPFMLVYSLISDEDVNYSIPEYSTGTGFAISVAGHVATNYHVVEDAENITVAVPGPMGSRKLSAKVIVSDEKNDLAILLINDPDFGGFDPIPYGFRNSAVSVGEDVFVLGYPMTETMGEEVKLTNGIVNSKTGFQGDITMYQISAPVQPGNSGGPLFDEDGNIIGVVSAKHEGAENVNYAVKISYLKSLIDILPQQIALEENNSLTGMKLKDQMSIVSNFTFLISVNEEIISEVETANSNVANDNRTNGGISPLPCKWTTRTTMLFCIEALQTMNCPRTWMQSKTSLKPLLLIPKTRMLILCGH